MLSELNQFIDDNKVDKTMYMHRYVGLEHLKNDDVNLNNQGYRILVDHVFHGAITFFLMPLLRCDKRKHKRAEKYHGFSAKTCMIDTSTNTDDYSCMVDGASFAAQGTMGNYSDTAPCNATKASQKWMALLVLYSEDVKLNLGPRTPKYPHQICGNQSNGDNVAYFVMDVMFGATGNALAWTELCSQPWRKM